MLVLTILFEDIFPTLSLFGFIYSSLANFMISIELNFLCFSIGIYWDIYSLIAESPASGKDYNEVRLLELLFQ